MKLVSDDDDDGDDDDDNMNCKLRQFTQNLTGGARVACEDRIQHSQLTTMETKRVRGDPIIISLTKNARD